MDITPILVENLQFNIYINFPDEDDVEMEAEDEKVRALRVLQQVVGNKISIADTLNKEKNKFKYVDPK